MITLDEQIAAVRYAQHVLDYISLRDTDPKHARVGLAAAIDTLEAIKEFHEIITDRAKAAKI